MNNEILKQLEYIKLLVDELQSTNLANEKKNILTKYYTINQELFSVFFDHVYSFDKKY
jgi:hypothetical protein